MRVRWGACAALSAVVFLLGSCGGTTINPTPTVSALYPETVAATLAGASCANSPSPLTLNVAGNNFMDGSVAYWNGSKRATTFDQNTGQLAVKILACDIVNPGIDYVSVVNPPPGGGPSQAAAPFQVTQPAPAAIKSISPASTTQNILPPGGTLTIHGEPADAASSSSAFATNSQVSINGEARATTYVSSTELQVQVLPTDVAVVGRVNVAVTNPGHGGSSTAEFSVTDPPNAANFPRVISVSATGGAANGASSSPAMSADGRYIAFYSEATNLVASGASGNVFVRDTCIGAAANCTPHTIAVDLAPDGSAPNAPARWHISVSAGGRYIAFASSATNLVGGYLQAPDLDSLRSNVFVRDMCFGPTAGSGCLPHTTQVSLGEGGVAADDESDSPSLTADGQFIAFESLATNLIPGISGFNRRMYVTDLRAKAAASQTTETYLVSGQDVVDRGSVSNAISPDGRYVVYAGWHAATGDEVHTQVYLRNTCLGADAAEGCVPATRTVSVAEDGADGEWASLLPSVSADGRFVVFNSMAHNLISGMSATSPGNSMFIRDTCSGTSAPSQCVPSTSLISAEPPISAFPAISSSGRFITFGAVLNAAGGAPQQLLINDTCLGAGNSSCVVHADLISVSSRGEPGNETTSPDAALSSDGQFIAFSSDATNLASPTSGLGDVLLAQMPVPTARH